MDWAGAQYEVDFLKKCWLLVGRIFENIFFHDRGRRGRSRRENSGKILAAELARCDFLMVFGVGGRSRGSGKVGLGGVYPENCRSTAPGGRYGVSSVFGPDSLGIV